MREVQIKKLAVIQLDGREELLYSLPAIDGLKKKYPTAHITLYTSTECGELIRLINGVDEFVFLDKKTLTTKENIINTSYNLIVNLSFSDLGIVFSSYFHGCEILGTKVDDENNPRFLSKWSIYYESCVAKTSLNAFHRSDIYKSIAGVSNEDCLHTLSCDDTLRDEATKYLQAQDHLKIAVSVASLNSSDIIFLIKFISENIPQTRLYLLGSLKDKTKSTEIISSLETNLSEFCVDLTGKLSFELTAGFLQVIDILISRENELIQLAAGHGTFTINIKNHDDFFPDSSAYNHGHLLLCTIDDLFLKNILAEALNFTAKINNGNVPTAEQWQNYCDSAFDYYAGKVHVFITQKNYTESTLLPLLYLGAEHSDCMRAFYKLLWLNEIEAKNEVIYGIDIFHETTIKKLTQLLKPLEQIYELAAFGQRYCNLVKKDLVQRNFESAKKNSNKLQEVDELLDLLADNNHDLIPIINYFQVSQSQITTVDPIATAVETTKHYLSLQNHTLILLELCETVFNKIHNMEKIHTATGGAK